MAHFDEYREWQWIKHLILADYAQAWSVIVGKDAPAIYVVDTCAGAASYTDPDTRDTIRRGTPVIFGARAKEYTEQRGPGRTMHVICCEKNQTNYSQLVENVRQFEPHVKTFLGSFERHVPHIVETIGCAPTLLLLDPIGVATIPADKWAPLVERVGKTDLFVVLHMAGVHRVAGWLLADGTPNVKIKSAVSGVVNMDRVLGGVEWRAVAVDPELHGEEHREERELRYVQLFLDRVIGSRLPWNGFVGVRTRYTAPVKYWLVHASGHEKPYEIMNDEVVKVNETLFRREHTSEGGLEGFVDAMLEAHSQEIMRELQAAVLECVRDATGGELPFGALRRKLSSRFFGRVRWIGGYSAAIRHLCETGDLAREEEKMRSKFEAHEVIRATAPDRRSGSGAKIIALKRVA